MQINYLDAVSSVLNMMKQPDSACKNIDMHRTCYTTLFKHLMGKGIPFSVDAALDWLEIKKQEISYETCSQYRNALFRLEHYLLFGDIESPFCRSEDSFFCRSGMSESFFRLTYELEKYYAANQNPSYYHTYSVATKEFFKLATSLGITEPEAVTIDTLIEYWNTYCKSCGSPDRCQNAVCAMTALMKYLHLRGDVPECYQLVLFGGNAEILPGMKLPKSGAAFHPSVPLEHKAEEYLDALDDWKYTESSKAVYRNDFTWYFMFLELNRLEHSAETVALWIDILPDCPNQSKASNSVSAHRSHTIKMFEKYLQGTMESNMTADPKRASDHLPPWSKSILDGFIENRRRDGMTNNTLTMCRAAGCGFFKYLEDNGIDNPLSITPHVVKAFHNHDVHSTPESKNAYGAKLRQLLRYMADQDLVPPTLVFAVSASCAPHRSIADVLSDDMVEKIYEYREKASTPIELRDTAMVTPAAEKEDSEETDPPVQKDDETAPPAENKEDSEDKSSPMNMDSVDQIVRQHLEIARLGDKLGLKGLDTFPVKSARKRIIKAVQPDLRLDGKDSAYIDAAFDIARSIIAKRKPSGTDAQRKTMFSPAQSRFDGTNKSASSAARDRMIARMKGEDKQ